MTEVETQALGRVLRIGLLRVLRQHPAQTPVHHVSRRVCTGDRQAAFRVNLRPGFLAERSDAFGEGATVNRQAFQRRLDVVDFNDAAVCEADRPSCARS